MGPAREPIVRKGYASSFLAALSIVWVAWQPTERGLQSEGVLVAGQEMSVALPYGGSITVEVPLEAGEPLSLLLQRHGQEAEALLIVQGLVVAEAPYRFGRKGTSHLSWLSRTRQRAQLIVSAKQGKGTVILRRESPPGSARSPASFSALAHRYRLSAKSKPIDPRAGAQFAAAALAFGQAAKLEEESGRWRSAAFARDSAGLAAFDAAAGCSKDCSSSRYETAVDELTRAIALFERSGDTYSPANTRFNLALALYRLGRYDGALQELKIAAIAARRIDNYFLQAEIANVEAHIYFARDKMTEALRQYRASTSLYMRAARLKTANTLRLYLAKSLIKLGRDEAAMALLKQVVEAADQLAAADNLDLTTKAGALRELGVLHMLHKDFENALGRLEEARVLDPSSTTTRLRWAEILVEVGRTADAIAAFEKIRDTASKSTEVAVALQGLCNAYARARQGEEFRAACQKALEAAHEDNFGRQLTWHHLAGGELQRGNLARARDAAAQSLDLIEGMRERNGGSTERRHFFTHRLPAFDRAIRIEMRAGDERAALRLFERRLARTLLEKADATLPASQDLPDFRTLLDADTVVLAYHLTEEAGLVWRIDQEKIATFALDHAGLPELVASWLELLLPENRLIDPAFERSRGAELSKVLFPRELRDTLGEKKRLVLLLDSALHPVPFAALPWPETGDRLIDRYEPTVLASLTSLHALREQSATRPRTSRLLVVGDPVYNGKDVRKPKDYRPATDELVYDRLLGTEPEILGIAATDPSMPIDRWVGWDASREAVLAGKLRGYPLLHMIAHGHGGAWPRLVLSQFDREGRPQRAELDLDDLAGLTLDAELAVLSACESGGDEVMEGEGLIGLGRGFMGAGVPRLVVSLWKIGDESSPPFMQSFYDGLLGQGLSSAAALRQAQLAAIEREAPLSVWAAFVHQGDWQGPVFLPPRH